MKFHIVQVGETLDKILFLYDLDKDELVEENRHIKNWNKLIPGTKLKIPTISQTIDSEIMEMEPFVEDYYPKINSENGEKLDNNKEKIVYQNYENMDKIETEEQLFEENNEKIKEEEFAKNIENDERIETKTTKEEYYENIKDKEFQNNQINRPRKNNYYYYYINPRPNYLYPVYYYPIYFPIVKK